jgi:hypothetical protein
MDQNIKVDFIPVAGVAGKLQIHSSWITTESIVGFGTHEMKHARIDAEQQRLLLLELLVLQLLHHIYPNMMQHISWFRFLILVIIISMN